MKSMLIVIPAFNHGGTNRSLVNLLPHINKAEWKVEILCMAHIGPYASALSAYHIRKEIPALSSLFSLTRDMQKKRTLVYFKKIFYKVMHKLNPRYTPQKTFKRIGNRISKNKYDVVISFQEGIATDFARFINAQKHISWVRCDYARYLQLNPCDETTIYSLYNQIVCVSEYTAEVFKQCMPEASKRVLAIHNLIDSTSIQEASLQPINDPLFRESEFCLVSVGRLDPVKRFSAIPEIAYKLKDAGVPFRWYIIGDGGQEKQRILDLIQKLHVENEVVMLGEKQNPYPYIAVSDVMVCLSISEACPNVINEAKILHVPIVTTDFPSVREYIISDYNGLIAPLDQIADSLIHLYKNKNLYDKIKKNIIDFTYDNSLILKQINAMLTGNQE